MAKESTNLGRTTVGEQIQLNPAVISDIQAAVKAQQKANPTLTADINAIASEVPVITDPTETYWSTDSSGVDTPVKDLPPVTSKFKWTDPITGQTKEFNTAEEMNAFVEAWKTTQSTAAAKAAADAAAATAAAKAAAEAKAVAEGKVAANESAYNLLLQQFTAMGLGSLVEPLKELITSNISPSEFALRLQQTDAYKKRFAANQDRINKGLRALTPAEYIGLEDQYQNIMRNYGLPASYYAKDSMGTQEGFNKFIANDVSAAELEDRVATAQKRVLNTNPEVLQALKQFYPDLNNADILAYTLDPTRALEEIKRKVTAAEIGGAALAQGLQASGGTAESLAGYGITKAQAQQGYQTIGEFLPAATKLGQIYQNPYDQATAEQEVFGTTGATTAAQKRKKLAQLETAAFSGQSGRGVLSEQRQQSAGAF